MSDANGHIAVLERSIALVYTDIIYVCNGLVRWLYCRWLRLLDIVQRSTGSKASS